MPHAFRSSALIEAENAQKKLDRLRDRWIASRDSWFDGSAESVERRIANVDEVIALARSIGSRLHQSKVGSDALSLLPALRTDRDQLVATREHLAGAHWFGGGDEEAGQFNLDPRKYPSYRDWQNASNVGEFTQNGIGNYIQQVHQQHPQQPGREKVIMQQAAFDFVADQNTTDRQELLIRAQRLIEDRTSSWTPEASREAVRAFVGAVNDAAPELRQVQASNETVEDFDDSLMYS